MRPADVLKKYQIKYAIRKTEAEKKEAKKWWNVRIANTQFLL